nr:DUF4865 family protein [Variibacter gotjawalensis]
MQYAHRLPADYDMSKIEERATQRGPLWDTMPGVGFKVFAARRRSHGTADNVYTSIYVWLETAAALKFLSDDRFGAVVSGFGRPLIETWLPVDVRVNAIGGAKATSIVRSAIDVHGADIAALRANENERNAVLLREGALAAVSGLDVHRWQLVRYAVLPEVKAEQNGEIAYDMLHFARPGWAALAATDAKRAA